MKYIIFNEELREIFMLTSIRVIAGEKCVYQREFLVTNE